MSDAMPGYLKNEEAKRKKQMKGFYKMTDRLLQYEHHQLASALSSLILANKVTKEEVAGALKMWKNVTRTDLKKEIDEHNTK